MRTFKTLCVIFFAMCLGATPLFAQEKEKVEIIAKSQGALILEYRDSITLTAIPISAEARKYVEEFEFDAWTYGRFPYIEFQSDYFQPYQFLLNKEPYKLAAWQWPDSVKNAEIVGADNEYPVAGAHQRYIEALLTLPNGNTLVVCGTSKGKRLSVGIGAKAMIRFIENDPTVFILNGRRFLIVGIRP